MYGKQTECAIGCASRLAEVFDGGKTRLNAAELAEARGLQAPSVAKILSVLSKAGIVDGSRGPGGGYALSRPPKQIVLRDIFELFERSDPSNNCPFGGGVCGAGTAWLASSMSVCSCLMLMVVSSLFALRHLR